MVLTDTFTVSVTLSRETESLYTNDWSYYYMVEYYEHMAELNSPSSVDGFRLSFVLYLTFNALSKPLSGPTHRLNMVDYQIGTLVPLFF